jgi:hypothetical protein
MPTLFAQIESLEAKLRRMSDVSMDPRMIALGDQIWLERKPKLDEITKEIQEMRKLYEANKPKKKPRWPEDCPQKVVEQCNNYWSGTTERYRFRIHAWNEKAIITSYPGGSYQSGTTTEYGPACYRMIPLSGPVLTYEWIREWSGRLSKREMQNALDKYAKS